MGHPETWITDEQYGDILCLKIILKITHISSNQGVRLNDVSLSLNIFLSITYTVCEHICFTTSISSTAIIHHQHSPPLSAAAGPEWASQVLNSRASFLPQSAPGHKACFFKKISPKLLPNFLQFK